MTTSLLLFCTFFYFVPILRVLWGITFRTAFLFKKNLCPFFPLRFGTEDDFAHDVFSHVTKIFSRVEYFLAPLRFYFLGVPLTFIFSIWLLHSFFEGGLCVPFEIFFWITLLVFLNFLTENHIRKSRLKLVEVLRKNPNLHPSAFFTLYEHEAAFSGVDFKNLKNLKELKLIQADFRQKGRPQLSVQPLLRLVFDTSLIAKMVLLSQESVGAGYAHEVSDLLASLWGKQALQATASRLCVRGAEKIQGRDGVFLFIFNHKSTVDFMMTYFVFSEICFKTRKPHPRFIVAKDHFKDNIFIYHMMGLGKGIEAMDMIFIERNKAGKGHLNLEQAAQIMIEKDIDIAIYPQGTRAPGNLDRVGKRRDAGYYTTLRKHDCDPFRNLSHLKKGTGYLIFDVLSELRKQNRSENLNLVFVGINGTATTLPSGSLKVQTENTIEFLFGDIVEFQGKDLDSEDRDDFSQKMNLLIDQKLKAAIHLHENLKKRYLTDLTGCFRFDEEKMDMVSKNLDQISLESDVAYRILDRIYALPSEKWNGYLSQLSQVLLAKLESQRFEGLLEQVTKDFVP